ncbi:hypothetical protein LI82_05030 [Methanococcoides methylutens]|uniref:Uncharacterized protein n=1 Tax=Methanococcoides methylutens TaxID=2226 RepID=A0A099T389_METMT|nr:hypothetical protein [Methanococcoides methylutens]KGK99369.1 hypothetical protein LI82_05030 [Methanococcoides methylutens]
MISILLVLFAIAAIAIYALTNYTSKLGALVSGSTAGITGLWADIQTSFSAMVWEPALAGNYYAMFALAGVCILALVMLSNLLLTDFRSPVQ